MLLILVSAPIPGSAPLRAGKCDPRWETVTSASGDAPLQGFRAWGTRNLGLALAKLTPAQAGVVRAFSPCKFGHSILNHAPAWLSGLVLFQIIPQGLVTLLDWQFSQGGDGFIEFFQVAVLRAEKRLKGGHEVVIG